MPMYYSSGDQTAAQIAILRQQVQHLADRHEALITRNETLINQYGLLLGQMKQLQSEVTSLRTMLEPLKQLLEAPPSKPSTVGRSTRPSVSSVRRESISVDNVPTGLDALEFNSKTEWNAHVEKLRDVGIIRDCLNAHMSSIIRSPELRKYRDQIKESLERIAEYVSDKRFEAPPLDEDTNEKMAKLIAGMFSSVFDELFRGLYVRQHDDFAPPNPIEQKLYDALNESFERYLASVGVERILVRADDSFAKYRDVFKIESYNRIKTDDPSKVDRIESIEVMPHFIPYATDDGDEKLLIPGKCCVWIKASKE